MNMPCHLRRGGHAVEEGGAVRRLARTTIHFASANRTLIHHTTKFVQHAVKRSEIVEQAVKIGLPTFPRSPTSLGRVKIDRAEFYVHVSSYRVHPYSTQKRFTTAWQHRDVKTKSARKTNVINMVQ